MAYRVNLHSRALAGTRLQSFGSATSSAGNGSHVQSIVSETFVPMLAQCPFFRKQKNETENVPAPLRIERLHPSFVRSTLRTRARSRPEAPEKPEAA